MSETTLADIELEIKSRQQHIGALVSQVHLLEQMRESMQQLNSVRDARAAMVNQDEEDE